MKQRLLLHVCCAPCAAYPVDILKNKFEIALLFYGPNIHPRSEYKKRRDTGKLLAAITDSDFIELEYDPANWYQATMGMENEPEGGRRCSICHRMRLFRAAKFAASNGYFHLATTLTNSPYKKADIINRAGNMAVEDLPVEFIESDFKKKDGFKKGCFLTKKHHLYRQTYCGCQYSIRRGK